jgi:hypothetical protein
VIKLPKDLINVSICINPLPDLYNLKNTLFPFLNHMPVTRKESPRICGDGWSQVGLKRKCLFYLVYFDEISISRKSSNHFHVLKNFHENHQTLSVSAKNFLHILPFFAKAANFCYKGTSSISSCIKLHFSQKQIF